MMVVAMDAIRWDLGILEPFLRGATRCPKEALFQKGSRIFNMATLIIIFLLVQPKLKL